MIKTREDLKRYLKTEKQFYVTDAKQSKFEQIAVSEPLLYIHRFVKYLRREEYHHNNGGPYHKLMYIFCRRRRNRLGIKLGIEIWDNTFAEGLAIWHAGNIVVNGHSKIGRNCVLHGSNCIGNNGKDSACPVIGDNVRLGVGAKVIGDITLADNITVAAGAVVVHSFDEEGITIAGVPAKKVQRGESNG